MSRKIFLEHSETIYKFVSFELQHSDGSLYLTFQREGESLEGLRYTTESPEPIREQFESPRPKLVRVSYHSSGLVRYHHRANASSAFEPLVQLTKINAFFYLVIPDLGRLDKHMNSISEEDLVVPINVTGPLQFTFLAAPWNIEIDAPHLAIRYDKLFGIYALISSPQIPLPATVHNHFTYGQPDGDYMRPLLDQDQSLIRFHQLLNNTQQLIIYSPNNEGVRKIVFSVPMRIPPETTIRFRDPSLVAEIVSKSKATVRFKIKDRFGRTVKADIPLAEIILDAEL